MSDILRHVSYFCENSIQNNDCQSKVTKLESNKLLFEYPCESLTDCYPYKVNFGPGIYRFELWGAQGGDARYWNRVNIRPNSGGKGAFVSGYLKLPYSSSFYFYIGAKGEDQTGIKKGDFGKGGYNGGGNGGGEENDDSYPESSAGGGGATDIRIIHDSQNEVESLKSRIAVAAAGGGASSNNESQCNVQLNPKTKSCVPTQIFN